MCLVNRQIAKRVLDANLCGLNHMVEMLKIEWNFDRFDEQEKRNLWLKIAKSFIRTQSKTALTRTFK